MTTNDFLIFVAPFIVLLIGVAVSFWAATKDGHVK